MDALGRMESSLYANHEELISPLVTTPQDCYNFIRNNIAITETNSQDAKFKDLIANVNVIFLGSFHEDYFYERYNAAVVNALWKEKSYLLTETHIDSKVQTIGMHDIVHSRRECWNLDDPEWTFSQK